jgi:arabinofuranosyltransferase
VAVKYWQAQIERRTRQPPILIALFVFFAGSVACAAYATWRQHPVIIDDAFISFRYARNWVDGHGLVFNPGERVQGYTNLLWVIVAAAAIALHFDPLDATQVLGMTSFLGCVVISSAVAFLSKPRKVLAVASAAVAALFYVLPHGFAALAASGLETSFLALVLLAMGVVNHLWPPRTRALRLAAYGLPLIAVLTRLDAALAVLASAVVCFFSRGRVETWRRAAGATVTRFGLAWAGVVTLLGWQFYYYGALLPNTYWAKGADLAPIVVGVRYLVAFVRHSPWVLFLAPAALWGGLWCQSRPFRRFGAFVLLTLALHAAYVVRVGGDFMQYRFMWEVLPLFITLVMIGLRTFPSHGFALTCVTLALPFATVESHLERQHEMHESFQMDEYTRLGVRVGKALSRLPPDTLLATTLAGTVGYYSGLPILDEWGLNDRYVAHLPVAGFGGRGHVKRAPAGYLAERQVNLQLGHPVAVACDKVAGNDADLFVRIGRNDCVGLKYLHRTPALTRHLCQGRDSYILQRVECPRKLGTKTAESQRPS